MENKSSVLNDLFVSREENICAITELDKKRIKELTKNNDTYQMLLDKLDKLSNDDIAEAKVKDTLESYIDKVNIIGSYENEKFYKIGFADAINLILECIRK
jgi:Zn-dependent M32 family carboxypeptidase